MFTDDINYASDGDSITVEASKEMQDTSQLVILSITSWFTEHNLNPDPHGALSAH